MRYIRHYHNKLISSLLMLLLGMSLSSCIPQKVLNYALKRDAAQDLKHYEGDLGRFRAWSGSWTQELRDTFMLSPNNQARLHAIYRKAPSPTNKTAFILHGYGCNSATMLNMARFYCDEMGYNVFLPDFYAHGKSEGKMRQMGWLDRLDMLQWMQMANHIFSQNGQDTQMLVTGVSMGGATTMMISGEVEKQGLTFVKCFIEDCGYSNVYDEFKHVSKGKFEWVLRWASRRCKHKYGWSFQEASATNQVAQCHLPMLFIHGGNDTFVPTNMVHEVHDAKTGIREIWVPENIAHSQSFDRRNREYRKLVKDFTAKYIHEDE